MASTYIPKVIQNRGKTPMQIERDTFERAQHASISKAITDEETPVKEKHVRIIIVGTHHDLNAAVFWHHCRHVLKLHDNSIVAWKFCYVTHRLIRDGHPEILKDSLRYLSFILELGKYWGLSDEYGKLIARYIKLLIGRFKFHKKYEQVPGTLALENHGLTNLCNNDINVYFELSVDLLDLMDDLLSIQKNVFDSLDMSRSNSMTSTGQCRLAPLILLIQDSCHLYDHIVKTLFKLHSALPVDTLDGHRNRFLNQYNVLKKFYSSCLNLQYFKNLIKVPSLAEKPPNFLLQSDIKVHKPPVAPPTPTVEDLIDTTEVETVKEAQPNYKEIIASLMAEIDRLKRQLDDVQNEDGFLIESLKTHIADLEKQVEEFRMIAVANAEESESLRKILQESKEKATLDKSSEEDLVKIGDTKLKKLKEIYGKLREEHIALLRKQNDIAKKHKDDIADLQKKQKHSLDERIEKIHSEFNDERIQFENNEKDTCKELEEIKKSLRVAEDEKCLLDESLSKFKKECDQSELRHQEILGTFESSKNSNEQAMTKLCDDLKLEQEKFKELSESSQNDLESLRISLQSTIAANDELEKSLAESESENQRQKENFNESLSEMDSTNLSIKSNNEKEKLLDKRALLKRTSEACMLTLENSKLLCNSDLFTSVTCSKEYLNDNCKKGLDNILNLQHFFNEFNFDGEIIDESVCLYNYTKCISSLIENGFATSNSAAKQTAPQIKNICTEIADKSLSIFESILNIEESYSVDTAPVKTSVHRLLQLIDSSDTLDIEVTDELIDTEMALTAAAIDEAADRIAKILAESRLQHTGVQLEVNERILESCTSLMTAIRVLIDNSKGVQNEIVSLNRGASSSKEFYKKHHRWTEGLISAAKSVGKGANVLVDAADKVVRGEGKLEELMVCSQEISASTTQLVVASKVKSPKQSEHLANLTEASKGVTSATGKVVATAKSAAKSIDDLETLDLTKLTLHQAKRLEMDSQVKLLELEHDVEKERRKLAELRRKHYQLAGEDEQ